MGTNLDKNMIDNESLSGLGFNKFRNRYEAKQSNFAKIPSSRISYWISSNVVNIIENNINFKQVANPRRCLATGNDDLYLRYWYEVLFDKSCFNANSIKESIESKKKWFPFQKGGDFRKWYGNNDLLVNWFNNGEDIKTNQSNATLRNLEYSFEDSLTWSYLTQKELNVRYSGIGNIFSGIGGGIFTDKENIYFILGLINTNLMYYIYESLFGKTITYESGNLSQLPIIFPKQESIKQQIDLLAQECIDISKEDWDSRETSWDFSKNEILKYKSDSKLETAYNNYCSYWKVKFYKLHLNEEELNRLFIDIYELGDELIPDVDLNDITILKQETSINDSGELEFDSSEIMKQFISYSVGVMFGRYSLDSEGLVVANLNQDYPKDTTYEIDEDNVIPVLEDDYFSDDIASRIINFIKTSFGGESLSENINFIEKCLGKTIRNYMVKDFYEDHIKRYKKRPIYWMVSSPKKGFMSLSYMHRYQSDIFARVQNNYLREYIAKLEGTKEILNQTLLSDTASSKDKKEADKKIKAIEVKLKELIAFDRDTLTNFAQNRVEIDLDDGVKVNYCKFSDVLYDIKGLC